MFEHKNEEATKTFLICYDIRNTFIVNMVGSKLAENIYSQIMPEPFMLLQQGMNGPTGWRSTSRPRLKYRQDLTAVTLHRANYWSPSLTLTYAGCLRREERPSLSAIRTRKRRVRKGVWRPRQEEGQGNCEKCVGLVRRWLDREGA